MESGPDSKLSETQTPELVKAGALRPWTTGNLPPAPEGGLAYLKKAVGPGLLLAGASLGAGEWLFGPAVTAQYGASLLWLAFLDPLQLAKIGAGFGNIVLAATAFHTFYANRVFLPPPLQSHWMVQLGVLCAGLFFSVLSVLVIARL